MSYEIRALSFGETLDTAFFILRNHFTLLVGTAAALYVPMAVIASAFPGYNGQGTPPDLASALVPLLIILVYFSVVGPVVMGSVAYAVAELYRGNVVTLGEALGRGWKIVLPLSGTALLAMLGTMLGILLLVIPGIVLMLSWLLWTNVMVFEQRYGVKALRRSTELMRGFRWRALGLLIVATVVTGVLNAAVDLTLGAIPFVGPVLSGIAQSASMAFSTAVTVVLYFDIRCRKEQFDLEHLASLVSEGDPAGAPA